MFDPSSFKYSQQEIKLVFKRADNADTIFDVWIVTIMCATWHLLACTQVNLVPKKSEIRPQARAQIALNGRYFLDCLTAKLRSYCSQPLVGVIASQPEGHYRHAADARKLGRQIINRFPDRVTVVDAPTKYNLGMLIDPC